MVSLALSRAGHEGEEEGSSVVKREGGGGKENKMVVLGWSTLKINPKSQKISQRKFTTAKIMIT